jgi:hypothetical protein
MTRSCAPVATTRLFHACRKRRRRLSLLVGLLCFAASANASSLDLFGPGTVSGTIDLRLVAADGERSWTDGGFGKARFGGLDGNLRGVVAPTEAELVWQPRLSWNLKGTVAAAAQRGGGGDLLEAYLTYKPLPRGPTHFSARTGLFWPPVSLEHEGPGWTVSDMITPSAINSWIGEEVKVVGAEATVSREIGAGRISATIAGFGFNDTAGTLLAFRGWAMGDLKAGAFRRRPLPPLNDFMEYAQAPKTKPLIELDNRPGLYGKIAVRFAAPVQLEAFYYRNRAKPEAVTDQLQWGWNTSFWNLGARVDFSEKTHVFAQALTGTTEMGIETADHYWVETRYRSAFLRLSSERGPVVLSGRLDIFDTREQGTRMSPAESEDGWAVTADAAWTISKHAQLLLEGLHLDSDRPTRIRVRLPGRQRQNIVQAALRIHL